MQVVLAGVSTIHLIFAALWTGSVAFVTLGVLPTAMTGESEPGPVGTMIERLQTISRTSALVMLLTGGHLAASEYTIETLAGNVWGNLVIAMLVLWFALAGLVEVGSSKLLDGFDEQKLRGPAREARPFFVAATVVALLLLIDAGILIGF